MATLDPRQVRTGGFGPSALATPANAVTIGRLLVAPLLFGVIVQVGPTAWLTAAWVTLALTDGIDGYLARRQGTTRSGAFLDPLADKALVLGALVALVVRGVFWWLPVTLIAVREIWMSVYRSLVGRRGVSVPARSGAKVKTVVQDVAVGLALLPALAHHSVVATSVLWVAALLAVVTGAQYLLDARRAPARPME